MSDYKTYTGAISRNYTATEKCLITIYGFMNSDAYAHISVNGVRVMTMQAAGNARNDMRYVLLNNGDLLDVTTGGDFLAFEIKKYTK